MLSWGECSMSHCAAVFCVYHRYIDGIKKLDMYLFLYILSQTFHL